jgi:hypothetical protein
MSTLTVTLTGICSGGSHGCERQRRAGRPQRPDHAGGNGYVRQSHRADGEGRAHDSAGKDDSADRGDGDGMSLVASGMAYFPDRPMMDPQVAGTPFVFDAATDSLTAIIKIPITGTIDKVHYRINAVSSPVMTHRIEMRTVNTATGIQNAAGTLYGSSTSITVNAATYTAGTNYTAAVACTGATAGDNAAITFDLSAFTSGTLTQEDYSTEFLDPVGGIVSTHPYGVRNTAASDVKQPRWPTAVALEYAGGIIVPITPIPGGSWIGTRATTTVNNAGATRKGNIYRPATPRRAVGIYLSIDNDGGSLLRLYDSSNNILATCTTNANVRGTTSGAMATYLFDSSATVNLVAGADYYVVAEGTSVTNSTLYYLTGAPSNSALALQPGGPTCNAYTYTSPNWSQQNSGLDRYHIGLLTDMEENGVNVIKMAGEGGGFVG